MALSCTDLRHDVRRTRWHVAVLRATYVKRPTIDRIASVSCLSIGSKRSVSQGALELFSIRPFHASETNVRRERKREREGERERTNDRHTKSIIIRSNLSDHVPSTLTQTLSWFPCTPFAGISLLFFSFSFSFFFCGKGCCKTRNNILILFIR